MTDEGGERNVWNKDAKEGLKPDFSRSLVGALLDILSFFYSVCALHAQISGLLMLVVVGKSLQIPSEQDEVLSSCLPFSLSRRFCHLSLPSSWSLERDGRTTEHNNPVLLQPPVIKSCQPCYFLRRRREPSSSSSSSLPSCMKLLILMKDKGARPGGNGILLLSLSLQWICGISNRSRIGSPRVPPTHPPTKPIPGYHTHSVL